MYKKLLLLFTLCFSVFSCTERLSTASVGGDHNTLYSISFIGEPIRILSTADEDITDVDATTMGYFNIVKVKEDLYYLYYIAVGRNEEIRDENYDLCMAYSSDGIRWKRGIPNKEGFVIMPGIIEQSVFLVPDLEFPFRLIGNEKINNKPTLCMWKSKDGIEFSNRKIILQNLWFDTQNTGVVQNGRIKLYTRLWNAAATNRQNAVVYFDLQGNQLTPVQKLAGDYLYNAAPLAIDDRYEIILPTFYNNRDGLNDDCYVKAYLVDGLFVKEIECGFNQKLSKEVGWVLISPYIINISGKNYISYHTSTATHDGDLKNARIDYWLLQIQFQRDALLLN